MYITEKKLLKLALYSNAIYIFLLFLIRPDGINFQKIGITSLLIFSALSLIFLAFRNRKLLLNIPKYSRLNFYLVLVWGVIIIIRSFSFSLQDWVTNFGNVYMGLAWLIPVTMILGLKIENWSVLLKAVKFMFYLMIFAFLFFLGYRIKTASDIKTEWTWLLRPVNFILLIGLYRFKKTDRITVFGLIAIYFIIAIDLEQRMEFLYLTLVLCFLLMDKMFTFKIKKSFLKYIFGGFVIIFVLIFTIGYEQVSSIVNSIVEFEDSRSFLYNELFEDLSKTNDKLFGRGSLGTYYSEFFEKTRRYWEKAGNIAWAGDVADRITTEVGYLQMILKGGFMLLILNILISFNAAYVAIFKSNNIFTKRLGYYILIISILSLISFRPAFTPTFVIFWMAIGTVLNKNYREMNDIEINKLINF